VKVKNRRTSPYLENLGEVKQLALMIIAEQDYCRSQVQAKKSREKKI
jgi:hypothetical protein